VAPALALAALFMVTDLRSVDYGFHWDEDYHQLQPVRDMVNSGVLLPRAGLYPSFCKWLVLLPTLPAALAEMYSGSSTPSSVQAAMQNVVKPPEFLLTARRVFIVVSALAILWVYGAALALGRPWWEATIAAAGLGLSWEYAYHARFLATDCIVVQFSALTLFMLALFRRTGDSTWLSAAAIAAGLGTSTKFPGVWLLAPVALMSVWWMPTRDLYPQAKRVILLFGMAFAAYLITTPATVMEPFEFLNKLYAISDYYRKGHAGYTVTSTGDHLRVVLTYFAISYFSPFRAIAVVVFAVMFVGGYVWIRDDRRMGFVILSFPVLFLAVFCATYRAAIVRNYLMIVPFVSLFMARGFAEVFRRLRFRWARWTLAGGLAAVAAAQAAWLIGAAETIRHVDPKAYVREAVAYVSKHAEQRFRLSEQVRKLAVEQRLPLPPNATDDWRADRVVFFAKAEGPNPFRWEVNDPWLAEAVFGPKEVNFYWYSTWAGHDRVVVMTTERAKHTEVPFVR
jgi:hypothetical protein